MTGDREIRPRITAWIVGLSALAIGPAVLAGTITADSTNGTFTFIDKNNKGANYTVWRVNSDGSRTVISVLGSSKTDPNTGQSVGINIAGDGNATYEVAIGGERYTGIGIVNGDKVRSQGELGLDIEPTIQNTHNLPFGTSSATYFAADNQLVGQFNVFNSSTATAYEITTLREYTGLDLKFFNPAQSDSAAAIASGQLAADFIASGGGPIVLVAAGNEANPNLSLPIASVDITTYQLLVGTASPILSNGGTGPPTDFSFAVANVPEPSSFVLLTLAASGAALRYLYRRGLSSRSPI